MSAFIEELLHQDEGTALDFKKEQYFFVKINNVKPKKLEKSELLKDILAFANSDRECEAYILIGVEEVKGSRSIVWGLKEEEHFDDASLQEFINHKTNRPIKFAYEVHSIEDKTIGIIRISKQKRPFYAIQKYGIVEKDVVYYRSGSSTQEANPDEIIRMDRESDNQEKCIQLKYDLERSRVINMQRLSREACRGYWIRTIAILMCIVGVIALFKFEFIFLSSWYLLILLTAVLAICYFLLKPYFEAMHLHSNRPLDRKKAIFIGRGRFMKIKDKNNFLVYSPTAKCIYPYCTEGKIIVVDAPVKEISRSGKKYVGICTEGKKDHSYHIDRIGVATPERFDWSRPEKNS